MVRLPIRHWCLLLGNPLANQGETRENFMDKGSWIKACLRGRSHGLLAHLALVHVAGGLVKI